MNYKFSPKTERAKLHLNCSVIVFLLIPFFKPASLTVLAPVVDTFFDCWMILAALVIGYLYLTNGKMSKILLVIIALETTEAVSTLLNSGDIRNMVIPVLKTIFICMLTELGVKSAPKDLIKAFVFVLGIECAINGITILVFPNGMYTTDPTIGWRHTENYFLAYDNGHIMYLLPFLFCFWIYSTYEKRPAIWTTIITALFSATVYLTWSATSVVGITVYLMLFVFYEFHIFTKLLEIKKYLLVVAAFFAGVVIFRIQNLFSDFIVNVLGKDLTFSGRTVFWDRVLHCIAQRPVLGWGLQTLEKTWHMIAAPHAHNYILQILYETGFVGLGCFLIMLWMLFKPLKQSRKNPYCFILSATIFCYLFLSMTEYYGVLLMGFWVAVIMAYHIKTLTEGLERPDKKKSRRRIVLRQSVRPKRMRASVEHAYMPK